MIIRQQYADRGIRSGVGWLDLPGHVQRVITRFAVFFITLFALEASAAVPVELDGPIPADALFGAVEVLFDPDRSRDVEDLLISNDFEALEAQVPNFGYTQARLWLRMDVVNTTAAQSDWRIVFPEDHLEEFAVYASKDGVTETLAEIDGDAPFSTRPVPFALLVAPLRLDPGERATVLIRYWSAGLATPTFFIESRESFRDFAATRAVQNAFFYGAILVLIVAALAGFVLTGRAVFLAYAAYSFFITAYLSLTDGIALQYLWPNWPQLSGIARTYAGIGINLSAAAFARSFLQTRRLHPRLDIVWRGFAVVCLIFLAVTPFAERTLLTPVLGPLSAIMAILMVVSAIVAARTRFREVRFFLLAWIGAAVLTGSVAARHLLGFELSTEVQNEALRFWLLFDALLLGLAVGDRYNQERSAGKAAMTAALREARRNLDLSDRLSSLEDAFDALSVNSRSRSEAVQNAVHDMRQPLGALRLKVRALASETRHSERDLEEIERSFAYVEDLVSAQANRVGDDPAEEDKTALRTPDLGTVLDAVHHMFEDEAAEAGVELRVVPTRAQVDVAPLVVMRCLSNLVSNAIKYAQGSRVLVGIRRDGDFVRVEVHDSGPGLDAEAFEAARARKVRLDKAGDAPGEGFGLAIVDEHAEAEGFEFIRLPSRAGGLSIALKMPLSDENGVIA